MSSLEIGCTCGRPTWGEVTDLCLELAAVREKLGRIDEDQVELVAAKRFEFYVKLGGSTLSNGAFRAKVRHELMTGEHI